ncbi:DNA helicase [Purpureocillium takamizusanense]|uniref:DNA helicase n=1 Tax=Purpureocillium takamizusanense TaxID=2060973 RepID=A0A9Q8QA91_9HYPO|nr:DNA helicase [Purpureocillium takamizusanense]UNI15359.1 DNA helicase [Purpureocillium takamizusanense]
MERPSLVRLDSAKIMADASEYRFATDIDVLFKEKRHFAVEEYGRAHRVRDCQPCSLIGIPKTFQERFGRVRLVCSIRCQQQLDRVCDIIWVQREPDGWHAMQNNIRLDLPAHVQTHLPRHGLSIPIQRQASEKLLHTVVVGFTRTFQLQGCRC